MAKDFDLEKMRSIGYMSRGRTRHTSAGTEVVSVREVKTETDFTRVTVDHNEAILTEHRDGRKDAELKPKPIASEIRTT